MAISSLTRRSFLVLSGAAAVSLAGFSLTGCGSEGDNDKASATDVDANVSTASKTQDEIKAEWTSFPAEPLKLYEDVPASEAEMPTVSVEELHDLMESGDPYVLVDVNSAVMYEDGHIDTAVSYPWSPQGFTQDPELPRGVPMVFYCVCLNEEDSMHMGYSAVSEYAYRNIKLLKGGTPAWQEAGYGLVK